MQTLLLLSPWVTLLRGLPGSSSQSRCSSFLQPIWDAGVSQSSVLNPFPSHFTTLSEIHQVSRLQSHEYANASQNSDHPSELWTHLSTWTLALPLGNSKGTLNRDAHSRLTISSHPLPISNRVLSYFSRLSNYLGTNICPIIRVRTFRTILHTSLSSTFNRPPKHVHLTPEVPLKSIPFLPLHHPLWSHDHYLIWTDPTAPNWPPSSHSSTL